MKKAGGFLLIIIGVVLIIISIMALVKAFDTFQALGTDSNNLGYVFGSIIFPLLLTVFGRWVLRKGRGIWRNKEVKN